ncbi:MAG: hypothetical protein ABGX22_22575 [Pirellulaceae bacterium]
MDSRIALAVLISFLALGTSGIQSIQAAEENEVTVYADNGRSFTGTVDPKTDDVTLWMRFESYGTIRVRRPIKWHQVVHVVAGGEELSTEAFREQLDKWTFTSTMTPNWSGMAQSRDLPNRASVNSHSNTAERALNAMGFKQRLVTVSVKARLAQWDNDAALDGVEVLVMPLDDAGRLVPVRGTVMLELTAPRAVDREQSPRLHGVRFQTVARSAHQVKASDFTAEGTVLRLRFRQTDPQFDSTWLSTGILKVRLVVPGSGVFRASVDDLEIRPFSPIRDLSERHHGRRYLLSE